MIKSIFETNLIVLNLSLNVELFCDEKITARICKCKKKLIQ